MHKVSEGAQKWMDTIKSHCTKSLKKRIRTRKIKPSAADKLISERNTLVRLGKIKESTTIDVKIAGMISEEGRKWAFMLTKYTDTSYSACMSGMWKILRDKYPKKTPTLPSAKID